MLQDCHLNPSWMPSLEKIVDKIQTLSKIHDSFRLWITLKETPKFPRFILEKSIKFAFEPILSIRENLIKIYKTTTEEELNNCSKPR